VRVTVHDAGGLWFDRHFAGRHIMGAVGLGFRSH
jgi:hypothetical protein